MKTSRKMAAVVMLPALMMLGFLGCASQQCAKQTNCCGQGFNCYGYHSTCWRPWPEECPPCPSYAIVPRTHEEILSDVRIHENTLPPVTPAPQQPMYNEPLPMPPNDPLPESPPQEGRARPGAKLAKVPPSGKIKPVRPGSR